MAFRLTISRAILVFGVAALLGLSAIIGTSTFALNHLKIGGALYNKIKLGNDLVADILPPPEYVIEAYLEATLAFRDPAALAEHRDRLLQLKKDYDDRRDFWSKSDLDPAIKTMLVEKSDVEVRKFWTSVEQSFLPALAANDAGAAARFYADVTQAYKAHRAIIDDIVKKTSDWNAVTEVRATTTVWVLSLAVWGVSAIVVLIICAGLLGVAFGIVRPIGAMTAVMERLAGGSLAIQIPSATRKDEIGAMAKAVLVFKNTLSKFVKWRNVKPRKGLRRKANGRQGLLALPTNLRPLWFGL